MTTYINIFRALRRSIVEVSMFVAAISVMFLPGLASADTLNRQLELGMSGSDVSALQTFLAQDSTIYPQGLVTGYFGFLTKAAVANFQSRNGIAAVGRVGPMTLPVLNLQMASGMNNGADVSAATISSVNTSAGTSTATVSWSTNELAKGAVYYSSIPLVTAEHGNSVDVSGSAVMTDTNFRSSQSVSLQGLQRNTTYYYLVYATDQAGNVSITWPATLRTAQ